jgi:hypothetical protein
MIGPRDNGQNDELCSRLNARAGRIASVVMILLAMAITIPANAQPAQTVEGATTFLSMLASRNDLSLNECEVDQPLSECRREPDVGQICLKYTGGYCSHIVSGTTVSFPEMKVSAAVSLTGCETQFTHTDHRLRDDNHDVAGDAKIEEFGPVYSTFKWDLISEVRVSGNEVSFLHPHPNNPSYRAPRRLTASSSDLATRVGYALEFLRINCDTTSNTGF